MQTFPALLGDTRRRRAHLQGQEDRQKPDRPYNEAERAAYANLAGIMGRAAAHMGRTITWKEMLASNFAFSPIVDPLKFGGPAPVEPDAQGNYPVPIPGKWVEV